MAKVTPLEEGIFEVRIAGLPMRLKTSHSGESVSQLVDLVDEKIDQVRLKSPNTSFQNSLILAALLIAEEQLTEKLNFKASLNELKADTLEIISEIQASPIHQKNLDV
ncbi:MAG: cell division protein ZapA [Bdellovibrionales bacterium]